MEASAVHHPVGLTRRPMSAPLLRLRSDEQLLAQFRAGNDDAFGVLHDRYRQRLFAYVRQMLSAGSRQDAEDVMQDVFVRAYGGLRADARDMNVRAWLYRVAHNRCIDHLRRPVPPAAEVFEVSRKPLHDPVEEAQRREDLSRLVQDIARLPDQQRSALLMRELDGMSYSDLAAALDVTVPAIKSLLVRARVGLVDAAEARDAACTEIRDDLMRSYDRGVKSSSRARRHLHSCTACSEYRDGLRGMRRSFAALSPVGFGPLAFGAKLLGAGGASGGAAAGSTAAAGGGAAGGTMAAAGVTATACKVAAVVCTAAIAGGAVEANQLVTHHHRSKPAPVVRARPAVVAPAPVVARAIVPAPVAGRPSLGGAATKPAHARPKPHSAPPAAAATPDAKTPDVGTAQPAGSGDTAAPAAGGTPAPADATPPSDSGTTSGGSTTPPPSGSTSGDGTSTGTTDPASPSQPPSSGDPALTPPATH